LVADESLGRTGLLQVGSRVRTRTLVRLAAGAPVRPVVAELARAVGDPSVRIAAFDDTQPGLRRFFSQLATYLGLVGLASLLGVAIQPVLARALAPFAPFPLEAQWDPWTIARGLALGVLTALLCALWPLLAVRSVPPSLILRRDVDATAWRARRPWAAALPIAAGLAVLAIWQAGSFRLGGVFVGAAAV